MSRSRRAIGVLLTATALLETTSSIQAYRGMRLGGPARCFISTRPLTAPASSTRSGMAMKGGGGGKGSNKTSLRIDRVLSNRGVGSRNQVGALIRKGRVAVEGVGVVKDPSLYISTKTTLFVDDVEIRPLPLLLAYNKPEGVHSTMGDPLGRESLLEVLPGRFQSQFHPVGRLDADTTGLLIFSCDGQLTHRLLHPKTGVTREYVAEVEGGVDADALRSRLEAGVETTEGVHVADLLEVSGQSVRLTVQEGKHRMVRRMLANAGHPVLKLHRVRYGNVLLGDLPEGEFREIFEEESEGEWALSLLKD